MRTNRSRSWLLLAVAAVTGAAMVGVAPASASEKPVVARVSSSAQSTALSHWTPKRLAAARSGDELLLGRTIKKLLGSVAVGAAQTVPGRQAAVNLDGLLGGIGLDGLIGGGDASTNGGLYTGHGTGKGQVVRTTGKVFFTMSGADFQCSGSSVKAANKSLVVTAGHCVNQGPGAFATNFVFIPGYRDGVAPYGTFAARKLTTTKQFMTSGDLNYDVGMVAVSPVKKVRLSDKVGAQGIAFNQKRGHAMSSFGYPAEAPYDGSKLAWCQGTAVPDKVGKTQDQGLDCNMTGGSSGGPWLMSYNAAKGLGLVNSLNSFKYQTGGLLGLGAQSSAEMYGPYFGSVILSLWRTAQTM